MTTIESHLPGRRRFGWYRPKPQGGLDICIYEPAIDEKIWNEFHSIVSAAGRARPFVIDYLAVVSDYQAVAAIEEDLSATLTGLLQEGMIDVPAGIEAMARVQQCISNFAGACSAFRDRASSRLSREFGNDASQAAIVKIASSRIHDKSFAYRFLYALRNYAQHHDMPISLMPINASRMADDTMMARIALVVQPSVLLASPKLNAKMRAELEAIGPIQAALQPLLHEYMTGHQEIMLDVLKLFVPDLETMAHYAAALYRRFAIPLDVVPIVWEGDKPTAGPPTQQRMLYCSFDEMARALALYATLEEITATATYHGACDHAMI